MYRGSNNVPKLRVPSLFWLGAVGEHLYCVEVSGVTPGGAMRRENVGMSSKKTGENPVHRKPKVSWATRIDPGLVGS
jgi:hypothetical protein